MSKRPTTSTTSPGHGSSWVSMIPVVVAFVAMAWVSWRKWPDLLIDFGMQLYVPWQLSNGATLYKDVAYLTGGPLSQLYHAFLFRLFGPSLDVLVASNLVIAILLLIFIYRGFRQCSDQLTATFAVLGVMLGFAFAQYLPTGNYNFLSPYSHEAFHGLVLSLLMVGALSAWLRSGQLRFPVIAGVAFGMVFMTKPELFLAATIALGCTLVRHWRKKTFPSDREFRSRISGVIAFAGAAIVPAAVVLLYFLKREDIAGSARAVCWAWVPLLTSDVANNAFYRWCLGLDSPWFHLRTALMHFGVLCAAITILAWICRLAMTTSKERLLFIGTLALLVLGVVFFDWVNCGRSLPLILAAGAWLCWRTILAAERDGSRCDLFPLLWILFSAVLQAKMGLHSRIWHYGFFLAMPAFVAAIYILLWLVPCEVNRFKVNEKRFRRSLCVLMVVAFLRLAAQSHFLYEQKNFALGGTGDRFYTYPPKTEPATSAASEALQWIETNLKPNQTFAALPEGAMLNYLSRRSNSAPYLLFNPAETAAYGETNMLAAYQAAPPDYILLVHRDTGEFGVDFFGRARGFGYEMMQWITNAYTPVHLIGNEPLRNHRFGIKILRKRSAVGVAPVEEGM